MEFDGRVAIVTGGAMGNGLSIVKVLASKGCKIAILDYSKKLNDTVADLCAQGYEAIGYECNIADAKRVNECVEKIIEHYGKVDILVNNAGVMKALALPDSDDDNLNFHIDVNIKGPWNVTKIVAEHMKKNHYGRIITLSSVTGTYVSDGDECAYALTKAALAGFGRSVAAHYIRDGITSNVVCPGFIRTPMVEKYAEEVNPEDPETVLNDIGKALPIGHLGMPEDIGYLVAYLASEHAGFMTGSLLVIDGGCILPETNIVPENY